MRQRGACNRQLRMQTEVESAVTSAPLRVSCLRGQSERRNGPFSSGCARATMYLGFANREINSPETNYKDSQLGMAVMNLNLVREESERTQRSTLPGVF